jgi:ABC-type polar amino acid transport system ATPase subunit
MAEHMIRINNVSKWYGPVQVLNDCSVNIDKGDVVVVCGPSGSGKSTLIKTVNALEPFQKGEITVNGIALEGNGVEPDVAVAVTAAQRGVKDVQFQEAERLLREELKSKTKVEPKVEQKPTP